MKINKMYSNKSAAINLFIIILSLLVLYQYRYGLGMLIPTNDAWLMKHDWATHYLGWFFYRNEPWGFPIGNISNYLYPVGTNVGFTDSIPLASIFFKIFSPILSDKFQFIGMWLFMCHVLLAYFLIKLFELFSVKGFVQLIGTLIIVFNPVLLHRSIHPALCSHWLIVGSIWVYFLDTTKYTPQRLLTYQGIFFIVGGLINPYFSIIGAGFFAATAWRVWQFDKTLSLGKAVLASAIAFMMLVVSWYIVGFFSFNNPADLGVSGAYGLYAFNLNSLYNSGGWSSFLPGFPMVSWHQYESFMYLGFGMIVLISGILFFETIRFIRNKISAESKVSQSDKTRMSTIPLLLFVVIISLFAITNLITINDKILLTIPLPNKISKIADIFRASARYFWVAYYLILFFAIVRTARAIKKTVIVFVMLLLVFVTQLYDYKALLFTEYVADYKPYHPPLDESRWRPVFSKMDRFIFYPPFESDYLETADYRYFCYLAADYGKPITLGYAARLDNKAIKDYTRELKLTIDHGLLDEKAVYITTPEFAPRFMMAYQSGLISGGQINGYMVFFSKEKETDQAFSAINNGVPEVLKVRQTFKPFSFSPKDTEVEWPVKILRLERSVQNIFFKMIIQGDTLISKNGLSILLKSEDDESFISAVRSINKSKPGESQELRLIETYFTDDLKPGNYKVAIYSNPANGDIGGMYRYVGNINVGLPDISEPKINSEVANVMCRIEVLDDTRDKIEINGWAFIHGQASYYNRIEIILKSDNKIYQSSADLVLRPDVTSYFNSAQNLDMSGFVSLFTKEGLEKGQYEIGVRVINDKLHLEGVGYTGRTFIIK